MDIDSKELSSVRVTDSALITPSAAELIQVIITQSSAPGAFKIYDGENATGDLKLDLKFAYSQSFEFPGGMYMRRGIYFYADTKVQCVTIRWRNRPSKE